MPNADAAGPAAYAGMLTTVSHILAAEPSIGSRLNPRNICAEMTPVPYRLPPRIRRTGEFFAVEGANAMALAYVYFDDDPSRRALVNCLSGAGAKKVAQMIARALTVATKSSN